MTYFVGEWKAICDICGFEFRSSELKTDYRGLKVCDRDLDVRNPQEFVRAKPERHTPTWTRHPPDVFYGTGEFGALGDAYMGEDYLGET